MTGYNVLELLKDKKEYNKSCIVISENITNIDKIMENKAVYLVMDKTMEIDKIIEGIKQLVINKEITRKSREIKDKIIQEITFLGYDISHKGTKYLVSAIEYIALNPDKELEILEKDIYSVLSYKFGESIHNIKCSINRATTSMYYECEIEKLKKYFLISKDIKPKVRTIIDTIINKIHIRKEGV